MVCPLCGRQIDDADASCPACGADLVFLARGALVAGRYEIRSLLGRGGMGAVYCAFDRVLHEEVALKVQRAEGAADEAAERRFRNEVRLARQVTHANVCRLHDGGQEGSRRWISMELVRGATLAARIHQGPLPLEEAWSLAIQTAEGLAAVHRAGVVHRDLKPLNLMVDAAGRLKIMDFGIAKPAAGRETGSGYVRGSPEYMSPEQARGTATDSRSDVYSLGIVLYELFTGEVPFRAETPVATLLQHLDAPPPLARSPAALRPLLERALAKNPAERFPDGGAFAEALRAARAGSPPSTPVGRTISARISAVPDRRLRALVFALVAVASGAAVFLLWSGGRVTTAPNGKRAPAPPAARSPATTAPSPSPPPIAITAARGAPPSPLAASPRPSPSPIVVSPSAPPSAAPPALPLPPPTPAPRAPGEEPPGPGPSEAVGSAASATAGPGKAALEARTPERDGALLVLARPWADVTVDGIPRGQLPLAAIRLPPGSHTVLLTHPEYQPYRRKVTIRSDETLRLSVDLPTEAVKRRR